MTSAINHYRQAITAAAALILLVVIGLGGSILPVQAPSLDPAPPPLVGRTGAVCPVHDTKDEGDTMLGAVAIRKAPGREGALTARSLGGSKDKFKITEQGRGQTWDNPSEAVVVEGEGVMAIASAGSVFTQAIDGADRGLLSAPCTTPATEHWFVGLGASADNRSTLVLTNPDVSQAEVDLQFFGPDGIVVVPGSPALVIPAESTKTIALDPLIEVDGPLTVVIRASVGRVAAVALDQASSKSVATGADWHQGSGAPASGVVIPGVPEGEGQRILRVVNPSPTRAHVQIEVLDAQGNHQPAGAEQLEIAPESTAEIELTEPLAGVPVAVRLNSDQPVTAAVISTSTRTDAKPDLAIQPAAAPVVQSSVAAIALVEQGLSDQIESSIVLTNTGGEELAVGLELINYDGVALREDTVILGPNMTDTRQLTQAGAGYLVISAPVGSPVYAGLVLSQPTGKVAGLTTSLLVSPDLASRAPRATMDPSVGR